MIEAKPTITDPSDRWTPHHIYRVAHHDEVFGAYNDAFPDMAVEPDGTVWLDTESGYIGFDPSEIEVA